MPLSPDYQRGVEGMKSTRRKEIRETRVIKRDDYIHIETDGCIVNIRPGLSRDVRVIEGDQTSISYERVTAVEVIPDGKEDYADETGLKHDWKVLDEHDNPKNYAKIRVTRSPIIL